MTLTKKSAYTVVVKKSCFDFLQNNIHKLFFFVEKRVYVIWDTIYFNEISCAFLRNLRGGLAIIISRIILCDVTTFLRVL